MAGTVFAPRQLRWIVSSYSPGARSSRSVSVKDTVHEGK